MARPINEVAQDIWAEWEKVNYAALPYLQAMLELDKPSDTFGPGRESGTMIVTYFLNNASSFRGPRAKELKAELKQLIGRS